MEEEKIYTAEDGKEFRGTDAEVRCGSYEKQKHKDFIKWKLKNIFDGWLSYGETGSKTIGYSFDIKVFVQDIIDGRSLEEVYELMKEVIETNKEKI